MNTSRWSARNPAGAVLRIVPLVPLVLAACQTVQHRPPPAMSLEEALATTASFQPVRFSPPPRSAEDVTALLEYYRLSDARRVQAHSLLTRDEPPGASKAQRAALYHDKANAAMLLEILRSGYATYAARPSWPKGRCGDTTTCTSTRSRKARHKGLAK